MLTHEFYLPPSPEGNLAFWDQNQGNQGNQTRKRTKYFLFPNNGAGCILQAHFPGSDLAYLGAWHVPVEACCLWKFIATAVITQLLPRLVRTQTPLLSFQSPNTTHTHPQ